MVICTMENGKMIPAKATESLFGPMAINMSVNGRRTRRMESALTLG